MKNILSLLFVSALGGMLTLGAYKLFLEPENKVIVTAAPANPAYIPASNASSFALANEAPNFSVAAENTVNSVVHVKNVTLSSGQMSLQDLFMGRSTPRAQMGTGSGVIINSDGYIITNNHVINNSTELSVTLNNNRTYKAEVVGSDPKTDIALLKIDADEDLPFVIFADSDEVKVGEWVLAVGNPFNLTSTVTAGIISAKARDLSGTSSQSFIQTDAAVNPGNSGGALVNTRGELIGINTAISSQTGSYVGYSFAVPSNIARRVIEDLMEYGNVQNGILGISGSALNSESSKEFGVRDTQGIYVDSVIEDSGAEKAGIKKGDIVKEIDNIKVSKFADLTGHINAKRVNDNVILKILRNGELKTVNVTLTRNETTVLPMVGTLRNATKEQLKKYNLEYGVVVVKLNKDLKEEWESDGVKEGSIITALNGKEVKSVDDIENLKSNRGYKLPYSIGIVKNNGEKITYRFR